MPRFFSERTIFKHHCPRPVPGTSPGQAWAACPSRAAGSDGQEAEQHLGHLQGQGAESGCPGGVRWSGVLSAGTPLLPALLSLGPVPGDTASAELSPSGHVNPALLAASSSPPNNSSSFKHCNLGENQGDRSLHRAACEELAGAVPPTGGLVGLTPASGYYREQAGLPRDMEGEAVA